jgi:hypothetical protein
MSSKNENFFPWVYICDFFCCLIFLVVSQFDLHEEEIVSCSCWELNPGHIAHYLFLYRLSFPASFSSIRHLMLKIMYVWSNFLYTDTLEWKLGTDNLTNSIVGCECKAVVLYWIMCNGRWNPVLVLKQNVFSVLKVWILTLLCRFVGQLLRLLVCNNEKFGAQIQKHVKELVGHEMSPALYPILFDQIKAIVEKFFDQQGQVYFHESYVLYPISICCSVVMQSSRNDSSLCVHCMYFF